MAPQVQTTPHWTPPGWFNRMMTAMLRTPGLRRLVGRSTALLTFTGRKTGRRYTTPVSYFRDGGRVMLTSHRRRPWWRNFESNPDVEILIAGRRHRGKARASVDSEESVEDFAGFLEAQPRLTKLYGITLGAGGRADRDDVAAIHTQTVLITIELVD